MSGKRLGLAALIALATVLIIPNVAFAQTFTYTGSITSTDPTQTGRVFRDEPESTCAAPQPGSVTASTEQFHYDKYTFTNVGGAQCITVTLDPMTCTTGTNFIQSAAYSPSFNPANVTQNFLADIGASPIVAKSYSFNIPVAAGATFDVVVNEVFHGTCPLYGLTVTGTNIVQGAVVPADVTLAKTDAPDPALVGQELVYTLTVINAGPGSATNVVVRDDIATGLTFVSATASQGTGCALQPNPPLTGTVVCDLGTLAFEGEATITIRVRPTAPGTYRNCARAYSDADPNFENSGQCVDTTVNPAGDLAVTKTGPAGPIESGANISYTITVTNTGPSPAQNVTLTDILPPGQPFVSLTQTGGPTFACTTPPAGGTGTITCTAATLASGASATFTLVVRSHQIGTATNTVTVTSTTADVNPANNTAVASTVIIDTTVPICRPTIGANVITVYIQDVGSGLQSITPIPPTSNGILTGNTFTVGQTGPVTITFTRRDRTRPFALQLAVRDVAGNVITCDPVAMTIRVRGKSVTRTFAGIPRTEHKLTVKNGKPGLRRLAVSVNGIPFRTLVLRPGAVRGLDLRPLLRHGSKNRVTVKGYGPARASALIALSD